MPPRWLIVAALFAVYVIWGSTYAAMAIGVDHFPPFMLGGIRYAIAGALILLLLLLRGEAFPAAVVWRTGAITGFFLLVVGNGAVNYAVISVSSGLAALVVASSSLFAALFARGFGEPVSWREWAGIAIGFAGVAFLVSGEQLRGDPAGMVLLVLASASWAFGSMLGKRLPQPASVWTASATQLLCGGIGMLLVSAVRGESFPQQVPLQGWLAIGYLALFGAIIAFSAYVFLLRHTRPALATSTAYVNPVIAVALGALLLGEAVTAHELLSMVVVLAGVVLVTLGPTQREQAAADERNGGKN